jgi:uncharacterized membrane protein YidH (DUF202 family)
LIKNQQDFYSGLLFTIVGGIFAYASATYQLGHANNMAPGFFPLMVSALLLITGSIVVITSLTLTPATNTDITPIAWRQLFCILGANFIFGILLPLSGLIVAVYGLTLFASLAIAFKLKESLILSSVLSLVSYVIFVLLLKINMPVWPHL